MITLSEARTYGNAYTEDESYERCYGLVGAPRRVIRYDWTIRRWRWMVVQPLRTSAERIDPVNADAAMEPEAWEPKKETRKEKLDRARGVAKEVFQARSAQRAHMVVDYLREHGPTSARGLREALGIGESWLASHLQMGKGTVYWYNKRGPHGTVWGLVGVHDGKRL